MTEPKSGRPAHAAISASRGERLYLKLPSAHHLLLLPTERNLMKQTSKSQMQALIRTATR